MEKFKKILSIVTIACFCLVALDLIGLLFGMKIDGKINEKLLITAGALAIGGFFAINSLNMTLKNKVLGFVSFGLIAGSVLLIIIINWANFSSALYLQFMFSLGLLSVLFNIIVSSGIDLGKRYIVLQVLVYIVVGVTDIIATLAIFGAINILPIITWFVMLIILSIVGVVILKVFAKKQVGNRIEKDIEDKNFVRITKEEYATLVEKAKKYDELQQKTE